MALTQERCIPCRAGTPPLTVQEAKQMLEEAPLWTLRDTSIEREFKFGDFREAIAFVNKVADLAEQDDHHPDIHVRYNRVGIELSTHKIGGLSRNDFILAAKVDALG